MTNTALDQILYLLDEAFDGTEWHSLLGNLRSVTTDDWDWVPPDGHRSIRSIVQHVGACKFMYENHAFGDATLWWDHPLVDGENEVTTIPSAIDWLGEGQLRLRGGIANLDDAELLKPRLTNWGDLKETRWIVGTMIQHDLYHAGEINHIRSLHQRGDRWEHDQET